MTSAMRLSSVENVGRLRARVSVSFSSDKNRKRQVQPRRRPLLIGGVLCRQTIELRDAQARELAEMIVE
jgi:hypothetical protein